MSGFGQMDPFDTANPFNAVAFIIEQALARVNVAKVVTVLDVQGGGLAPVGTVTVQIMTNQLDGNSQSVAHGSVFNVPYIRYQGGRNAVISDPKPGDQGLLVCCDRDISAVKSTLGVANPGSNRKFSVSDGIFIGVAQTAEAPEQYVQFTDDGMVVHDKSGNDFTLTPEGILVTDKSGSTIEMKEGNMTFKPNGGLSKFIGNVQVTGELTGDSDGTGVGLNTHTHAQGNDSHGDTEVETNAPTPGT